MVEIFQDELMICNRCEHIFFQWDEKGEYNHCPNCNSCQICGCCPCNKSDCYYCGETVAYKTIRKSLLEWSASFNGYDGKFKEFKKAPQRLMTQLRKEYYEN